MILLEYEAKALLSNSDIPVPHSQIVNSSQPLATPVVLKSQVPVGGRGKAGGIKVVDTNQAIEPTIEELLRLPIKGYIPHTILAEEKLAIKDELYLSIMIDRSSSAVTLLAHTHGGIEVESNDQQSFYSIQLVNSPDFDQIGQKLAEYYNLAEQTFALQDLVEKLHKCFIKNDATLIEINPLILTSDNKLVAGDCKMTLDSAATFRHADWSFEQEIADTNFITLNPKGAVATIANGAGLAMATVDSVVDAGFIPANFLDIGGGASEESVLTAFREIIKYPKVEAIVINIFAGITRCDEIARAILAARKHISTLPPLYIRLAGTNIEEAKILLEAESISLYRDLPHCLDALKKDIK